jgi:hypothetical protein
MINYVVLNLKNLHSFEDILGYYKKLDFPPSANVTQTLEI